METAVVMIMNRKGAYGDLMLQGPFLFGLRQMGAKRIVVIYPYVIANHLLEMGLADQVCIIDDKNFHEIDKILKLEQPKWAITLRGSSFRCTYLIWKCKGALTFGWSSFFNNIFLGKTSKRIRDIYWPFILDRLLVKIGGKTDVIEFSKFLCTQNTVKSDLITSKRFVFLPSGSIDAKQWGISNYLVLGKLIKKKHPEAKLIAVLGPREELMKNEFESFGWNVVIKPSPSYLMAICAGALGIVANDSGPSHIGQMSGAPIVVLYPQLPTKGWNSTTNIFKAYWWKRQQSYALCTKHFRPISDIPVEFVLGFLVKAMDTALENNSGIFYWE